MKLISVRDAKTHLSACLADSQRDSVVVTHHGKPKSVVIGVEGYSIDELVLMFSPQFWKMIEARRRQPRTPLEHFEQELSARATSPKQRRGIKNAR